MQAIFSVFKKAAAVFCKRPAEAPLRRRLRRKRGFSIIELIVVAAVLGILAAVAIAGYRKYLGDAVKKRLHAEATIITKGFLSCAAVADEFSECASLEDISFQSDWAGGGWTAHSTTAKPHYFCAHFNKTVHGKVYKKCVQIENGDDESEFHYDGSGFGGKDPAETMAACQATGKCK